MARTRNIWRIQLLIFGNTNREQSKKSILCTSSQDVSSLIHKVPWCCGEEACGEWRAPHGHWQHLSEVSKWAPSCQVAKARLVPLPQRPTHPLADTTSSSDSPPVLGNSMPTETLDSGFEWSLDVVAVIRGSRGRPGRP